MTAPVVIKQFWCGLKKRHVIVTFAVKGRILREVQGVVDCPALHDSGGACDRRCLDATERRQRPHITLSDWPGL